MTTEYQKAREIISLCRENFKSKIIFAGGYHVSALPELSIRELNLDFVVIGEGEITMKEICSLNLNDFNLGNIRGTAYLKDDKFIQNNPREFIKDLDTLPIMNRELIHGGMNWYLTLPGNIRGHLVERCTTIITSRGCPGNCIFCASRAMWSNKVRQRSVDNVIKEIQLLKDKYKIKGLFFLDDIFTINKKWILEFCQKMKDMKFKIKWGCSARVSTINEEILYEMKSAGCVQLDFGVESGSDQILKNLKKGQNKIMVQKAFDLIHKHRLKTLACFIIGNPGETKKEMNETFQLAKEIKPDFAIFSILTPLPGSPLYNMAVENNWINKGSEFGSNWSIRHSENPVLNIKYSSNELLKIRKEMEDHFFFQNYIHYFFPLLRHPVFMIQVVWIVIKSPLKYFTFILGKKSRRFSGFIESIYYEYKEWKSYMLK
ncbi:hypothetical protein ES705_18129 [subsurface metagenome]